MKNPPAATTPDGRPIAEQPRWRRDFPTDLSDDEYQSRRDLIKFMVLTSFAFTGGHVWLWLKELRRDERAARAEPLAVARVDELPVGGAKVFEFPAGSSPRLLVRLTDTEFVAYDQQCTHLLCPVLPEPQDGKLHCPCHNGWFDLATGRPLAGPPRRPLPRVTVEVKDGLVWATGVEGGAA
jgi:nitrite reductase/ring-hydroxylating ferredoxin subunit